MRFRFFVFLFLILFVCSPLYSATTNQQGSGSGSGTLGKPSVKFKEWQIGRSDRNTDSNNDNPTSFITSTQDKCHFTASVGYDGNQGDNVSPIDVSTISWTITGQDPSSMALVTSSVRKNWSGSHPSRLAASTSFNVVGTISLPAVVGSRTVYDTNGRPKQVPDYLTSTSCSHPNDDDRSQRVPRHRNNTKLGFTLVFSAKTEDGQDITPAKLVLKADEIDQVRQEYVDYNRVIPTRRDSRWQSQDFYDFGHYQIMLNIGLGDKWSQWVAKINELKADNVNTFSTRDLAVTSGYRNPHHNFDHSNSVALLSSHMYGYALDVRGKAKANWQLLDIDGDGRNTGADRTVMVNAAKATGSRETIVYSTKHVHADWAPPDWEFRQNTAGAAPTFSLPPRGTDSALIENGSETTVPVSSGCANNPDRNWCTDTGSCATESGSGIPGTCGHNYCQCARHNNTNTGNNSNNNNSSSSGCANNPRRNWCTDTGNCATESGSGIPGTCGHNYCQCARHNNTNTGNNSNNNNSSSSGCANNPRRNWCTDTGSCSTESGSGVPGTCGHNYCQCARHNNSPPSTPNPSNNTNLGSAPQAPSAPAPTTPAPETPSTPAPETPSSPTPETPSTPTTPTPETPSTPSTPAPETPTPETPPAPQPTTLPCGHLSTASGDHSLQASCTSQDSNGNYCTATRFYQCQHTSHTYPAPPPPPVTITPTVVCPANSVTSCGRTTSHAATCSASHSYYTCNDSALSYHKDRTCTRCGSTYQGCTNTSSSCQGSRWHTETPQPTLVACGAASWTGCTSQLTSSTAHQVTCSGGHSYWTCGTANAWHRDRTCSRCSQTYQNCSNSATACQGSRWHTE